MEDQAGGTVNPSDLKLVRKLGNGCQAEVYEVQHAKTGQHFAVKMISTHNIPEKDKKRAEFEVSSNLYISKHIHSNRFPLMYTFWPSSASINILFELCDQNAQTTFKKLSNYAQRYNFLIVLTFDMLLALKELQQLNIIHRDIKPENILVKEGIFKLSDLGLSRVYDTNNSWLTNDIGNRLGRSPEFITGIYTCKADIWSLGVNIFYLLQNTLPFDQQSLFKIKNNPNDIEKIVSSPSLCVDLQASGRRSKNILSFLHLILSQMIVIDSQYRNSSIQLLQSFFQVIEGDSDCVLKNLLICYLQQRQSMGNFYLMLLLGYHQFYRMDGKIKDDLHSNKRKICNKVKNVILNIIKATHNTFNIIVSQDLRLIRYLSQIINKLEKDLLGEIEEQPWSEIDDALLIYKINKVKQKFPLIEWMVKLFKIIEQKSKGLHSSRLYLWDIPLQIYKII